MRDGARLGFLLAVGAAAMAGGGSAAAKGEVPKNDFIEFIEAFTGQEIDSALLERREIAQAEKTAASGLRDGSLSPAEVADQIADAVAETDGRRRSRRRALEADLRTEFDAPADFVFTAAMQRDLNAAHAAQSRLEFRVSAQGAGAFSRLGKSLEKAGSPTSLVIPGTDTPLRPLDAAAPQAAAAGPGPFLTVVGTPDGKLVVRTLDPARGDPSGLSWIGLQGAATFDAFELRSDVDFSTPGPKTFAFTGLAPGNYVLYGGNRIDLDFAPRDAQVVTVPGPAPATGAGVADIATSAKLLGRLFSNESSDAAAEFQSQVRGAIEAVDDGDLTQEGAVSVFAQGAGALFGRVWALREETLAAFGQDLTELSATDPAAADRAAAVGMRSPADALDASLAQSESRVASAAQRIVAGAAKSLGKRGFSLSYSIRGLARGLHPGGAAPGLGATADPLRDPLVALLGDSSGALHVVTRDPALGRGTDASRIEIFRPGAVTPVASRDLLSPVHFADHTVQPFHFLGFPTGLYFVFLTTDVQGVRIPVGLGAIFIPEQIGKPPLPPPVTDTTFTAAFDGAAYATPPFQSLRVNVLDGKLYGIYARFADSSNASLPQFNFQFSPPTPIPVGDLTDAETVLTKPPANVATLLYAFRPDRLTVTAEQSATYRVSGIKSLVDGTGGARVEVDAMWGNWNTMTPARFVGTMTLHTDDATR